MPDDGFEPPDTYSTHRPRSPSSRAHLRFLFRGELLDFEVDRGIFSRAELDRGTELLIENTVFRPRDQVLEVGCGWGAVGVAAAKSAPQGHVVLTDVNRRAVHLARRNLERNGITNAEVRSGSLFDPVQGEAFDVIVTNPPYRAGRPVIERLIAGAPGHLRSGGRFVMVGKGSQGIRYYQEQLVRSWPGPVIVVGRGSGYRVLEARLTASAPARRGGVRSTPPSRGSSANGAERRSYPLRRGEARGEHTGATPEH